MTDREKLIELLGDYFDIGDCGPEDIADHLIAHGVTFGKDTDVHSKWISVHERLPDIPEGWLENPNPVFFVVKGQDTIEAGYYGEQGTWRDRYFRTYRNGYEGYDADDVLCWMWQSSLPLPPREE